MMKYQQILASLFVCLVAANIPAFGAEDPLRPRIPLHPGVAKVCPVSILTPFSLKKRCSGTPYAPDLTGCLGVWVGVACSGWNVDAFTSIDMIYFKFNIEHNEFSRMASFGLYHEPFDQFVRRGAGGDFLKSKEDDTVILDASEIPQLSSSNLVGACGQEKTRKIKVAPISGENWAGWMWEQSFDAPKKKLTDTYCQKFTPDYRCVTLAFGNDKISAIFPTYCFLRKKVDNLDIELSFDVFMDMVKTIRFNEGEVTGQSNP